MTYELLQNALDDAKNISEMRALSAGDALGGALSRLIPYIPVILLGWGVFMGVVVDLADYREAMEDRLNDVTDNICGLCGHHCALTIPFLNYCGCWITIAMGGGCSCLACTK